MCNLVTNLLLVSANSGRNEDRELHDLSIRNNRIDRPVEARLTDFPISFKVKATEQKYVFHRTFAQKLSQHTKLYFYRRR